MSTQGFTLKEKLAGAKLMDKLYPYVNGQRKRAPDFDKLIEGLTEEEVNSDYLAQIEYGYDMGAILSHPKLKGSTVNKAAVEMVSHEEFDNYDTWCRGINALFMHGAENPYHINKNPKENPMWPTMAFLPDAVVGGDILAPIPVDPKDAKAFLSALSAVVERREKGLLVGKKQQLDAEKATPERQKVSEDLKELDETMKPSTLRQRLKRQMVAEYRKDHPKSR